MYGGVGEGQALLGHASLHWPLVGMCSLCWDDRVTCTVHSIHSGSSERQNVQDNVISGLFCIVIRW